MHEDKNDRGILKTSVGFVDSIAEFLCPMFQGCASAVCGSAAARRDPTRLAAAAGAGNSSTCRLNLSRLYH